MKFEYRMIKLERPYVSTGLLSAEFNAKAAESTLNKLGEAGWELVNIYPYSNREGETTCSIATLKRGIDQP